ncbi:MAG: DNA alkylation repair protein [Acidobacteriota bacterium]
MPQPAPKPITAAQILTQLRAQASPTNLQGMARFAIRTDRALGIPTDEVNKIARPHRKNHALALDLWNTNYREAQLVAILIADPAKLTGPQMDRWASQLDSWDVCDSCAIHLFRKSPLAWKKALVWSKRKPEFIRRLGFAMVATLAVHDKTKSDDVFEDWLPRIEAAARDPRNFVKKAVNWALRQIGKRNPNLRQSAIEVARRLSTDKDPTARWIANDALRELNRFSIEP